MDRFFARSKRLDGEYPRGCQALNSRLRPALRALLLGLTAMNLYGSAVAAPVVKAQANQVANTTSRSTAFTTQLREETAAPPVLIADPAPISQDGVLQGLTICIDPGHPSEVGSGTQGRHITEIQAAWRVSLKLKEALQSEGARVIMTKTSEKQFVRNKDRAFTANRAHAALMVRLHCDADAGTGIATYAPDRQGTSGGRRGPDKSVIEESQRIAPAFHAAMVKALGGSLHDRGLHADTATAVGGRQGALTGSIYSEVPVVLVEMCVLTNRKDEAFMETQQGQEKMARALAAGVIAAVQVERG